MFSYQLALDNRCVGHDLRATMLKNKRASFAAKWVSDTARAA